jgi:prophage DNA circulation protein
MSFVDDLQAAIFGVDISEGENWADRLAEAAYTTPSGLRITFDYEDISTTFEKKTTAFEFPDADGTLVQDKGRTGQKFPWRIFFWGGDVDKKAAVFEAAMKERGFGQLETPLYGKFTVVPFGEIRRIDALKTAYNQVIFEVTFWETIEGPYPATVQDAANAALTALDLFNDSSAAAFATSLDQGSISEEQGLLDTLNDLVDQVGDVLDTIAAVQAVVQDALNDAFAVVDNALQTFVGDPLTLAFNVQTMIQTPATAMGNIGAQLDAYGNLAADIFGGPTAGPGGPGTRFMQVTCLRPRLWRVLHCPQYSQIPGLEGPPL